MTSDAAKPDYTRLELPPPPADRPYVLVNMVMSADGKVVVEGTEQGLGTRVDQRLMRELRVNADVVLNGAETLRKSGASPKLDDAALAQIRLDAGKERLPVGSIISASGNLPLGRSFFASEEFRAVVYLSRSAPKKRQEAVAATGREVVLLPKGKEFRAMLRHMREGLGASVLLCEGGPTVNAALFRLDAVDEYFVTIGPRIVAGKDSLTAVEGARPYSRESMRQLALVSAIPNPDTGEVYLRYRVKREP